MTAHRHLQPPLDAQRALMITAMVSHISVLLDPGTDRSTLAAGQFLARVDASGLGKVISNDQHLTLRLFEVQATAQASTVALLRNWQTAARQRLEAGVWA